MYAHNSLFKHYYLCKLEVKILPILRCTAMIVIIINIKLSAIISSTDQAMLQLKQDHNYDQNSGHGNDPRGVHDSEPFNSYQCLE